MHYQQHILSVLAYFTPTQLAYGTISFAAGLFFFGLVGQFQQFHVPTTSAKALKSSLYKGEAIKISELPAMHLLGKAAPSPLAMPNTRLQLSLKGLYSSDEPELGSAIIDVPGHRESVYQVGDTLPGGIILAGVYPDRVVIDRDGQLEVLKLVYKGLEEKEK